MFTIYQNLHIFTLFYYKKVFIFNFEKLFINFLYLSLYFLYFLVTAFSLIKFFFF